MAAALSHQNGIHDKQGTDSFKWALCICIGYECWTKPDYAKWHGIPPLDPEEVKAWIHENADLASHDGDFDAISLLCGAYKGYVRTEDYGPGAK